MIDKVSQFISNNSLFNKEDNLLIAISGGADSVCLFLVLYNLGYKLELAHCNFNLRGDESKSDEKFVIELANKFNVKIHCQSFNTLQYAKKNKISIQMSARELRYNWFTKLIEKNNLSYIATGHHIDDHVETFFINLIRGCGLKGFLGIAVQNDKIVRPLLCVSRVEIEEYLKNNCQTFRSDTSNNDTKYIRNKIVLNI